MPDWAAGHLRSLVARLQASYNDRDFEALRKVFDEDVEAVMDGARLHGVAAVLDYLAATFREFPRVRIDDGRVLAESGDTIVSEHPLLDGDPSRGPLRPQGSVCEIHEVRDGRVIAYRRYYAPENAGRADVVKVPARAEESKVAEEQAALRRVATLVARGVAHAEVFAAVNEEVGWLVGADPTSLMRFEADDTVTLVAAWSTHDASFPIGARRPLDDELRSVRDSARVLRFGPMEPPLDAPFVAEARQFGVRSGVVVPIVVDRRVWGVAFAGSTREQPFPEDVTARIAGFTELVATAIANTEARTQVERLADEQAALRRVAMLVARGASPEEVFAATAEEVGRVIPVPLVTMGRYESDGTMTFVASWGKAEHFVPIGRPLMLGGKNLHTIVFETGQAARIYSYDDVSGPVGRAVRAGGVRSGAGTPIIVEGRLWGMMAAGSSGEAPLPDDVEARLALFTELIATAIANADSRVALARLAEEQAALRRVATQVARGAAPEEVFAAVIDEAQRVFRVDAAQICRYEADRTITILASTGGRLAVGSRWTLGGHNLATIVFETGGSARIDRYEDASGPIGAATRAEGYRSAVGSPIIVDGHLWGMMAGASSREPLLPADAEARFASFTELVATAIANAESRAALAASRARVIAAGDETRRRIERDLHDGAQQRLVHAMIVLKLALRAMESGDANAQELVAEALRHAEQANRELRELAHGILPAALTSGGLRTGVEALLSRTSLPVDVDIAVGRLQADVEATAYFIVSEALTNVVKHARAHRATVKARTEHGTLEIEIRDDGFGGADPRRGTGLVGLSDRIDALGGTFRVTSPAGKGTTLQIRIPAREQPAPKLTTGVSAAT